MSLGITCTTDLATDPQIQDLAPGMTGTMCDLCCMTCVRCAVSPPSPARHRAPLPAGFCRGTSPSAPARGTAGPRDNVSFAGHRASAPAGPPAGPRDTAPARQRARPRDRGTVCQQGSQGAEHFLARQRASGPARGTARQRASARARGTAEPRASAPARQRAGPRDRGTSPSAPQRGGGTPHTNGNVFAWEPQNP